MKKPIRKSPARKRQPVVAADELLPEYDFSKARRNPYAGRVQPGGILIVLDPDVAVTFPDASAVNAALRVHARHRRCLRLWCSRLFPHHLTLLPNSV